MIPYDTPILIPLPQNEFWQKIRELIKAELEAISTTRAVDYEVSGLAQKPLFKAKEVCAMFQITRQTMHQWVKEGILKPYKIKSRVYFLWSDLEKLITPRN